MVNIINLHTSLAKLIIFQTKKEHGHLKPAVRTLGLQAASAVQLAAIRMSLDRVSARLVLRSVRLLDLERSHWRNVCLGGKKTSCFSFSSDIDMLHMLQY